MLHSKFSTSFDHENQSVSIWITHKVNEEMTNLNLNFYFDENGFLEIEEPSKRESFKYLARHVKTTMPKLKEYLEDLYKDDKILNESYQELLGNPNFRSIWESE